MVAGFFVREVSERITPVSPVWKHRCEKNSPPSVFFHSPGNFSAAGRAFARARRYTQPWHAGRASSRPERPRERKGFRMSQSKGRQALPVILDRLHDNYPNARYELDWKTPLELLVATILAAQCTDERVN